MANEITWRLEHEKIGRLLLHYAIPAVIGTMVNALYNIVDRVFFLFLINIFRCRRASFLGFLGGPLAL